MRTKRRRDSGVVGLDEMDVRIPSLVLPYYVVRSGLSAQAKLVFAAIYTTCDPTGEWRISYRDLAKSMRVSERSVYRQVQSLRRAGFINVGKVQAKCPRSHSPTVFSLGPASQNFKRLHRRRR